MRSDELIEYIRKHGKIFGESGVARTRISEEGLFVNIKLLTEEYQGDYGFSDVSGIRRLVSAFAIVVTDGKAKEGDTKIYYRAQQRAKQIDKDLTAAPRTGDIIHKWVSDYVYETPDENVEEFYSQVGMNFYVLHSVEEV